MGHIIQSNEVKFLEKSFSRSPYSGPNGFPSSRVSSARSWNSTVPSLSPRNAASLRPHSPTRPARNPSLRPQSPSRTARSGLHPFRAPRRYISYFGCTWKECVQGVANILPAPYSECWVRCIEQLMHYEGPLPEAWRIYIAIMALCRHEVTWVVRALVFEFISSEGDQRWLSGIRFAPKKLQSLTLINKILAHRPWLLTSQHILELTKGEESWSISELCHALCLLSHFHSFASFLHSCLPLPPSSSSLTTSYYLPSAPVSLPISPLNSPAKTLLLPSSLPDKLRPDPALGGEVSTIKVHSEDDLKKSCEIASGKLESCETLAKSDTPSLSTLPSPLLVTPVLVSSTKADADKQKRPTLGLSSLPAAYKTPRIESRPDDANGEPKKTAVAPIPTIALLPSQMTFPTGAKRENPASPQPSKQSKNDDLKGSRSVGWREETPSCLREFLHLCPDLSFAYVDFPPDDSQSVLAVRDFNWQEHGYTVMTRLLNEMANLIDDRLSAVNRFSHPAWLAKDDGAYHYRRAVWNYVQSMFGVRHEDYVYSQIDVELSGEVKAFIKRVCCRPETLEGAIPSSLLAPWTKTADSSTPTILSTPQSDPASNQIGQNVTAVAPPSPSQLIPLSVMIMEARLETQLLYALKALVPQH